MKVSDICFSSEVGGDDVYRSNIQPYNVTIAEDTDMTQLYLVASEHMNQTAVCALDKGQLVPGTFIPLPVFGDDETSASICQSSDHEICVAALEGSNKLEYLATKYSVGLVKTYDAMQIVVYEIMLKKFERKREIECTLLDFIYDQE